MPITWNASTREFRLGNGSVSYVLTVLEDGSLGTLHFGAPLHGMGARGAKPAGGAFHGFSNRLDEPVALECPTPGSGDYRAPALVVEHADGSSVLQFAYRAHRISPGKPPIPGLPATYAEAGDGAETLEVELVDARSATEATLLYSVFREFPVVVRSMRIRNAGKEALRIRCVMSASVDLPDDDWLLLTLSGAWGRERHVQVRPLRPGRQSVASVRGASGHEHNPFLALTRSHITETSGEAIGVSLVYSGNFLAEAEVGLYRTTRLRIGLNPEGFCWTLAPGEELATPEAVLAYTSDGLGTLSDAYHRLYRTRLARGVWRDRPRPVLLNNWEGTYFAFDEARLIAMAEAASSLGIELFVLDDGWFGRRDSDDSSLGDWIVDRRKLPNGIDGLARRVEELGLRFGLWVEPEMVSKRSELFEQHPDWAIGIPGRERTEGRNQYVLDMGRPEVVEHLYDALSQLLASAPISYVKWDMNRSITEPYSLALPPERQGEFFHRYMLGVYDLYRRLTTAFPEVLFESCAGGGGRFDPGMLAFAPQTWTSDDTDAVERLRIQWGTSLCYPPSSMAAHVSAVPNHQTGRITPLSTRAAVAFFGVLGYELDPTALSPEDAREIVAQVVLYKEHRELFQGGRFLRLRSPLDGDRNETAWMVVSADRRHGAVGYYRILNPPNPGPRLLRLRGLEPDQTYRVSVWPDGDNAIARANAGQRRGDELMAVGLAVDARGTSLAERGDFSASVFLLDADDEMT